MPRLVIGLPARPAAHLQSGRGGHIKCDSTASARAGPRQGRVRPAESSREHDLEGSLNRVAFSATVHCLTGCGIGEVLGMVIGTALGWGNWSTVALAVALAFFFGYLLTIVPLLRAGIDFRGALRLALAADTASITIMEIVDNAVMLVIPGAMDAGLDEFRFWGSLALALVIAGMAAFPVVRWLIAQGRGHAVVHRHHAGAMGGTGAHGGHH